MSNRAIVFVCHLIVAANSRRKAAEPAGEKGGLSAWISMKMTEYLLIYLLMICPAPDSNDLVTKEIWQSRTGISVGKLKDIKRSMLPIYIMRQLIHKEDVNIDYTTDAWVKFAEIYGPCFMNI